MLPARKTASKAINKEMENKIEAVNVGMEISRAEVNAKNKSADLRTLDI